MTEEWAKWERGVINGVFPLHHAVSFSDHSAVFLTEYPPLNLPTALLKLVPAIPTLRQTQLAQWTAAASLTHPNLIRLLETGRCQLGGLQFLFVVMEYAQLTFEEILSQHTLAPEALRKGLRPILASLAFLHGKQLVQGGLKPSNILLVNQQVKLASDTVRPSGESTASIASCSVYDPPESTDGGFSTAGDIWSLGVFMVEALTQCQPSWPDRYSRAAVLPETLPPEFVQIVRRCLSRNPARRPTVAELEAQINPVPRTPGRHAPMPPAPVPNAPVPHPPMSQAPNTPMPHVPVLHTLAPHTPMPPVLHTLVPQAPVPEAPVTETAVAMPAMAEMTVGDEEALVAETPWRALVADTPGQALVAGTPGGEALAGGTLGGEALASGTPGGEASASGTPV